jgi:monovalent cation:H+ antiporter, CPA1 family
MNIHHSEGLDISNLFILMSIATVVAVAVKRIKIPYTIALVIVGLIIGFFHIIEPIILTEHLVLFIFLPALLFEAAWNLNVQHIKNSISAITIFATIGVAIQIFIIGFFLNQFLDMPWLISFVFGAIVAPTDPVSVVAIMKKLHLDHKLSSLVEGESLCNDGTSVVFFKLILALIMNFGMTIPLDSLSSYLTNGFIQFLIVIVGGAVLGAILGLIFSVITKFFDDHLLELTFTTIVAYGSFLLAESISVPGEIPGLHLSGVVATVAAGLVKGNYGRHTGMSASTKIVISSFWEYAAFFMNSLIFLLIGLEIQINSLIDNWFPILIAITGVSVARIISIYFLSGTCNLLKIANLKMKWQHILVMSGLRGALSMALILAIPRDLISVDLRETLILMVFGVVLFTLVIQGLSISSVIKFLGLGEILSPDLNQYQKFKAETRTAKAALIKLNEMKGEGEVLIPVAQKLQKELEEEIDYLGKEMNKLHISNDMLILEDTLETRTTILKHRKSLLEELTSVGRLSNDNALNLRARYDDELDRIQSKYH